MTWHYKVYEREQPAIDRKAYADEENEARAARLGLWADMESVPPWELGIKENSLGSPVAGYQLF